MAYNENIPQPGDQLSQSQASLLNNFAAIKALVDQNHATFGDPNQGKHKFLQMPEQVAAPTTAVDEAALYTKAVSAVTQLFFRNENGGTEVQLTGPCSIAMPGYITLPGGLIVQWGSGTTTGSGTSTILFPMAFPTSAFLVMACAAQLPVAGTTGFIIDVDGVSLNATSCSVKGFIGSSAANGSFYYIALGK